MATVFRPPVITRITRPWYENGYVQSTNFKLLGGGTQPFNQTDWPVPKGPGERIHNRTWLASQNIAPSLIPFHQTDWPNPRGYTPGIDLRTWVLQRNLIPPPQSPFHQTDWPNPRGYTPNIELRTWLQQRNIAPSLVPFHQLDWINPRGIRSAIDLSWYLQRFLGSGVTPGQRKLIIQWLRRLELLNLRGSFDGS